MHACTRPCSRCHQSTCSAREDPNPRAIKCDACLNRFSTNECYQNHLRCTVRCGAGKKEKTVCAAYKRCPDCFTFIQAPGRPRSDPHDCDAIYCSLCKKFEASGHLCFMKTGQEALRKKQLVGGQGKPLLIHEEHGLEGLLFESGDFLPAGNVQKPPATKRGEIFE